MSKKSAGLKVRLNLQVDEETSKKSVVLRQKHHINLSSLCRDAIIKKFEELEK